MMAAISSPPRVAESTSEFTAPFAILLIVPGRCITRTGLHRISLLDYPTQNRKARSAQPTCRSNPGSNRRYARQQKLRARLCSPCLSSHSQLLPSSPKISRRRPIAHRTGPCPTRQPNPSRAQSSTLAVGQRYRSAARVHDQRMIHEPGPLQHQYPGEPDLATRGAQAGAHFTTIAENLARGTDPAQIHQTWMSTPTHRANLLDPSLNAIGIAVIHSAGSLNAVEDFSHSAPVQSYSSLAKHVSPSASGTWHRPRRIKSGRADDLHHAKRLRRQCQAGRPVGRPRSHSLTRRAHSPDSHRQILLGRGRSLRQQAAPQFTTYNVAVLLY